MNREAKQVAYGEVTQQIMSVADGETDIIALMATVSALLHTHFSHFIWTGFYRVGSTVKDVLIIGPYQGELGCLRIPFSKGVCGAAATQKLTQVVDDVHQFPGHITCDPKSESEIVIPVLSKKRELIGVLDIDAAEKSAFDDVDRVALEGIINKVFGNS